MEGISLFFYIIFVLQIFLINESSAQTSLTEPVSVNAMLGIDSNIYVGTSKGVFHSSDGGKEWINIGLSEKIVVALAVGKDSSSLFAGTNGSGLFVTTNNGLVWNEVTGLDNRFIFSLIKSDTNMIAGTNDGIFLSTNDGTYWTKKENTGWFILALAVSDNFVIAGSYGSRIFISSNNGISWNYVPPNSGLTDPFVRSLFVYSNGSDKRVFAGTDTSIFVTTDNGTHWTRTSFNYSYVSAMIAMDNNLFAGTYYDGVFLSTNNGANWINVSTGLTSHTIYTLAVSDSTIFAGTDNGVFISMNKGTLWTSASSGLTNVSTEQMYTKIPESIILYQNYPNPFNSTTAISFNISSKSDVSLKVFDIIGREVAIVVSGEMSAGSYSKQWNASALSSGIYYYRLQVGNYTQTKKLLLLK